jgi:hypothetical protein
MVIVTDMKLYKIKIMFTKQNNFGEFFLPFISEPDVSQSAPPVLIHTLLAGYLLSHVSIVVLMKLRRWQKHPYASGA